MAWQRSVRLKLCRFTTCHLIGLGTLCALDDVELHFVAFLQGFISVQLDRAVVNEHIGTIGPAKESISLGIVEPLYFAFKLRHFRAFLAPCQIRRCSQFELNWWLMSLGIRIQRAERKLSTLSANPNGQCCLSRRQQSSFCLYPT